MKCKATIPGNGWACTQCGFSPETKNGIVHFAPELQQSSEGFHPSYFASLAALEGRSFWFQNRNKVLLWVTEKMLGTPMRMLEIGVGTGFVLTGFREHYPDLDVHGSELFPEGLQFAQQRLPNACFYQMDARNIPFKELFDLIGAFDVLEHIEEDTAVLSEAFQALRPGGRILITVPQHQFLWSVVDEISYHQRRYSRSDLLAKLKRAGFEPVYATSFVSLLFPVLLLARFSKRGMKAEDYNPMNEHTTSGFVNTLFGVVMAVERTLIKLGVRFPFGGSLLVAARKPIATKT